MPGLLSRSETPLPGPLPAAGGLPAFPCLQRCLLHAHASHQSQPRGHCLHQSQQNTPASHQSRAGGERGNQDYHQSQQSTPASNQSQQSTPASNQSWGCGQKQDSHQSQQSTPASHQPHHECKDSYQSPAERTQLPPFTAKHTCLPPITAKVSHQSQQTPPASNPSGEQLLLTNHSRQNTAPPPITERGTTTSHQSQGCSHLPQHSSHPTTPSTTQATPNQSGLRRWPAASQSGQEGGGTCAAGRRGLKGVEGSPLPGSTQFVRVAQGAEEAPRGHLGQDHLRDGTRRPQRPSGGGCVCAAPPVCPAPAPLPALGGCVPPVPPSPAARPRCPAGARPAPPARTASARTAAPG